MYNEIMEMISYLPSDNSNILSDTSSFPDVYNKSLAALKQQKT